MDLLAKATAINPGYTFAYYVKSLALIFTKQFPDDCGRRGEQCAARH
jgi:hypothetical protein